MTQPTAPNRELNAEALRDIQGNLLGFNKDHLGIIPLTFGDAPSGRAFLSDVAPRLATGYEVLRFNALYKLLAGRRREVGTSLQSTWVNLWLSQGGLTALGAIAIDAMPAEFQAGMAARDTLGDVGPSAPSSWLPPFANGTAPHAMLVIAADDEADLAAEQALVLALATQHGVTHLDAEIQLGNARPGDQRGHEHFGFKDGISQPSIAGLHAQSKDKEAAIAAGEFVIGYEDEDGNVSGQPPATPQPPSPPTPYNPQPQPPQPQPLPAWAHNGSFVVYRRLQQDVGGFRKFEATSTPSGINGDRLVAKLVGRWPSGAPLERVPGEPQTVDPTVADPTSSWAEIQDDDKINNVNYDHDGTGSATPLAAHIRKVNPRSDQLPDNDDSRRHRMLRRGLPYGPEFVDGEQPYGASVPADQDRGLLFICYQASIARSFEFVQSRWANAPDFPASGAGHDPVVTQTPDPRSFQLPPEAQALSVPVWVRTTGGAYFFSPSLSGIAVLAAGG